VGQHSIVCIATSYRLDGLRIESRRRRDFPHPSRPDLGLTQPLLQWVLGLSWGVKRPGHGVDHPTPTNAKIQERVELYLYSPSGPSQPVLGKLQECVE